ncbi:MAG: FG-GAP-like repeat-containing protein [Cyclobacteriaceae bacterium]
MKQVVILSILTLTIVISAHSQAPVISSIAPVTTFPSEKVVITGSGFSATSAQLQVWFNHVRGTITASSEYAIEVTVPASARTGVLEVINLNTRLSAKSTYKFSPFFGGTTFDPALMDAPLTFSGATNELFDLCSCDLNADGKPDIAATKFGLQTDIMLLENTSTPGSLSFTNLTPYNVGAPTEKITCGDLNGDGKPELVFSRDGATKNVVFVLPNTSAGAVSFDTPVSLLLDVGTLARFVSIRDLNGDGKPEIIVTNSNGAVNNQLYVFQNQSVGGVLNINPTPIKVTVTGASTTYGLDVQDVDNDGKADLIVNQFQTNTIFVLRNQSTSTISFAAPVAVTAPGNLNAITSADVNEDGKLDLIATSTLTNQVLVLLNTSSSGSISFAAPLILNASNGPWGVDVADIDGDQDTDIIVANRNQAEVNVFLNDGNNANVSFTRSDLVSSNATRNVIVGDLDGDAKPDIAYSSFNSGTSTYKVEILRNKNCYSPAILNEAPLAICAGQTITLSTIPGIGVTYDWKESGTTLGAPSSPTFDISAAGDYSVTATSESGNCVVTSPVLNVTSGGGGAPVDPAITSNSPVCTTQTLSLGTTTTGVTYDWSGPSGFTSTVQNPTIPNVSILNAGIYSLTVTTPGGCRSNEVLTRVDVADLQNFTITSPTTTICSGTSVILSINAVTGHQYQWIKDGADIGGQIGTTLNVTQEGTYKVRVQNIALGCSVETNEIAITVLTAPVVDFIVNPTACSGTDVTFTDQSTLDSRATPVYAWAFGDGTTDATASPTHTYTTAQNYNPSLTVSYSGVSGCSSNTSKPVNVVATVLPAITSSILSSCPGEEVILSITGTFSSINWSTLETSSSITVNQPGTYTVTTTDGNGCTGNGTISINSSPVPTLIIAAEKTSIVTGQSVQLEITGADTYSWQPIETLSDPNISNPIATPSQTTTYLVDGMITGGCSAQASITIEVNDELSSLNVPNVFSPNGDGFNDLWVIPGIDAFSECTLSIFDKSGSRIFEQRGYQNNWDGTINSKNVPDGTYFFIINCADKQPLSGSLLVAR